MLSNYYLHLSRQGTPDAIIRPLDDYLHRTISCEEAGRKLGLGELGQSFESIANAVILLAQEFPGTHLALVALVKQTQSLPGADRIEYAELLRDAHDSILGDTSNYLCMVGSRLPDDRLVSRWINLSAFLAMSEARGAPSLGWDYAIYSIAPGLEAKGGSHETTGKMDVFGSSSAHWLTNLPDVLYQASREGKDTGRWGMGKYSMDRWLGWKARMEALRQRSDLGHDTKELMVRAELAMELVEKGNE
ncbi:hypothetical protein GQ53DRAFT_741538 [Thozetella sp. PMI_491]|nr:hypothetical protein GQ53DRAFT_741538 [Thozetella sp. PMI_491]